MSTSTADLERRTLRIAMWLTALVAAAGVLVGLVSGSMSIVFDGLFSVVDLAMLSLSSWVSGIVLRSENRRFQYGYWHLEPMALAFNGGMLVLLCLYGVVSAVQSILDGGQSVSLGWALGYSAVVATISFGMWAYERRVNKRVDSEFLRLDTQSWFMTAVVSAALLVAFAFSWWLGQTRYAELAPFIDPAMLGILSAILAFMPVAALRSAVSEVLLIAPHDLERDVRIVMDDVVARHGFLGYTSYSAKVGRGRFIEVHIRVEPQTNLGSVAQVDALRDEIAHAIGGTEDDTWLTVDFTSDERWQ